MWILIFTSFFSFVLRTHKLHLKSFLYSALQSDVQWNFKLRPPLKPPPLNGRPKKSHTHAHYRLKKMNEKKTIYSVKMINMHNISVNCCGVFFLSLVCNANELRHQTIQQLVSKILTKSVCTWSGWHMERSESRSLNCIPSTLHIITLHCGRFDLFSTFIQLMPFVLASDRVSHWHGKRHD